MSEENVERVREAYAAFNRGDLEAAAAAFHPEAVWHTYLGALETDVYRGRDMVMKMWTAIEDSFGASFRMEPLEVIDCGEQVVVVVEAQGIGKGSGVEVAQTWAQLVTMGDGLVVRVEPFPDRGAALAAAGRRE